MKSIFIMEMMKMAVITIKMTMIMIMATVIVMITLTLSLTLPLTHLVVSCRPREEWYVRSHRPSRYVHSMHQVHGCVHKD
jgi:hypothetical protein